MVKSADRVAQILEGHWACEKGKTHGQPALSLNTPKSGLLFSSQLLDPEYFSLNGIDAPNILGP